MTTIRIKLPKIEEVEFTLEVEEETKQVRGNAMHSRDKAYDKKIEDEILHRLDKGDVWAWAAICVKAKWRGMEGVDCLACCCYKDEEYFKKDGYYEDMKLQAYDDLIDKLKALK